METQQPPSVTPEQLPVQFGRYTLRSLIGEGGMARVFQADLMGPAGFVKPVALKLIRPSQDMKDAMTALINEAKLGGLLRHPNIVDIYDFGEVDGDLFVAMELVSGLSLRQVFQQMGTPPIHDLLEILLQVCRGLQHAHSLTLEGQHANLVHRDLKPSNIMISHTGQVKVVDFGIARAYNSNRSAPDSTDQALMSTLRGSPAYMSPEQVQDLELDHRSDIFSMGALLYEFALGERLFKGNTQNDVLQSIIRVNERLSLTSFHDDLDAVLPGLADIAQRTLQRDPNQRYAHISALADDLLRIQGTLPFRSDIRGLIALATQQAKTQQTPGSVLGSGPISNPVMTLNPVHDVNGKLRSTEKVHFIPLTNIGPEPNPFVGREEDIERIDTLFKQDASIVTLLGPAGTGKTRLATKYGRQRLQDYSGGVWFCDLSNARSLPDILTTISEIMDIHLNEGGNHEEHREQVGYTLAGRGPTLVILDNLEQIVAVAQRTIGKWSTIAKQTRFLVTTRERLRLAGEYVVRVDPLPVEDAMKLFHQRATIEIQEGESELIRQIVSQLDCIPLAVELAAAQVKLLPPKELMQRLDQRLQLLKGDPSGGSSRQATLRGAIDWSWNLLEEWEQSALAQCSVFRGGFHLDTAEEVIDIDHFPDAPWVIDAVGSLLDKSLLHTTAKGDQSGGPRFDMYDSIRAYAAEKLEQMKLVASSQERHAHAYLAMATDLYDQLDMHGEGDRLKQLAKETNNLMAVHERTIDTDPVLASQAILTLHPTLTTLGHAGVNFDLIRKSVVAIQKKLDPSDTERQTLLGRLLLLQADHRMLSGEMDSAEKDLLTALPIFKQVQDPSLGAAGLVLMAKCLTRMSRFEEAEMEARQALMRARSIEDGTSIHGALTSLATALMSRGANRSAETFLEEALHRARRRGARRAEGVTLALLANLNVDLGNWHASENFYEQALAIHREIGNRRYETVVLANLGNLHLHQDHFDKAEMQYRLALERNRAVGDQYFESIVRGNIGVACMFQQQYDESEAMMIRAIALQKQIKDKRTEGYFRSYFGALYARTGRLDEADAMLTTAKELLATVGDPGGVVFNSICTAILEWMRAMDAKKRGATQEAEEWQAEVIQRTLQAECPHPSFGEGPNERIPAEENEDVRIALRLLRQTQGDPS